MKRSARLINEFVYTMLEAGKPRRPRLSKDSVDDQIDSVLLKYESDCIVGLSPAAAFGEGRLHEAPGDDEDEDDEKKPELGDPEDDEAKQAANQIGDKDDEEPDVPSDPLQPKIDLRMFAGKVSRLATNYDALLNMPIAIVNRARNYLQQNYSEALANEFSEIMERDFGIDLEIEDTTEPREKPMATGAAATGLGG